MPGSILETMDWLTELLENLMGRVKLVVKVDR